MRADSPKQCCPAVWCITVSSYKTIDIYEETNMFITANIEVVNVWNQTDSLSTAAPELWLCRYVLPEETWCCLGKISWMTSSYL